MSTCEICGREPLKGNSKSHSNIKTIRRQKLNLQAKKINGKRMIVCTSCLRTLVKQKTK
ncbi:50S ribosomal protein L28 [Candidatus Falkowbacteria bacterium]|nr:50S ribosomal protein L28 [Candidatus Falkowbacteria bacterium]